MTTSTISRRSTITGAVALAAGAALPELAAVAPVPAPEDALEDALRVIAEHHSPAVADVARSIVAWPADKVDEHAGFLGALLDDLIDLRKRAGVPAGMSTQEAIARGLIIERVEDGWRYLVPAVFAA